MRIVFVLPSYARAPIGGYKVVYEYADRLCRAGHEVTVLHPRAREPRRGLGAAIGVAAWRVRNRLVDRNRVPWVQHDRRLKLAFLPDLAPARFPDADILIATAWQTAGPVAHAPPPAGRGRFYLIQGYETWSGEAQAVEATWRLPLHKIVITRWLLGLVERLGEGARTTLIANGVDRDRFRVLTPPEDRFARRVGMLYHPAPEKGAADGIRAVSLARVRYPDLQCVLFGTVRRPKDLPSWIEYREALAQEQLVGLYNECAIFLQPSWSEGWGLTSTEAMACGCALVTTDNGGSREFALHGRTAVVAPARDPAALGSALLEVLADARLRNRLATEGARYLTRFSWERSAARLEALFEASLRADPGRG